MKQFFKFILILFVGVLSIPTNCFADTYLLSVGIADYPGSENDLLLPVNDANAIVELYQKNTKTHVVKLTNSSATTQRIVDEMTVLFSRAKKDDIIVFFFSGHGMPNAFCTYDGFLSYEKIRNAMAKSACKNKMIFADACYSGKFRTTKRTSRPTSLKLMLFLSSRHNEPSREREGMKNGFFTTSLISALKGGADKNRDRTISAKELFDFVSPNVKSLSRNLQHPVMWGNFSDSMPVMIW